MGVLESHQHQLSKNTLRQRKTRLSFHWAGAIAAIDNVNITWSNEPLWEAFNMAESNSNVIVMSRSHCQVEHRN